MFEVGCLHSGGIALDAVFLRVYEESDLLGLEKDLSRGVLRDGTLFVIKLHVLEAELGRPPE